ncbi:hypothetical protein AAK967_06810 [Atopobiaceae bacterium 24-176]
MAQTPRTHPLPPFTEALVLPPLPGDTGGLPIAVVDVAAWRPTAMRTWGYLVLLEDAVTVRILGCLETGGAFWPCSAPLDARPSGEPLARGLMYTGRNDGEVEARVGGAMEKVALWGPCPGGGQRLLNAARGIDLGPYGAPDAHLDFRAVTVAGALLAWRLQAENEAETRSPAGPEAAPADQKVLDVLLEKPLPDAVDEIVAAGGEGGVAARYAARSLEASGASDLRAAVAATGADVVRLASTHLWWMRFPPGADPAHRDTLLSVEAALNRIQLVLDGEAPAHDRACDEAGFGALRAWTLQAADALDGHTRPNPMATFHGVEFARGGEWDVRSRMARACERLRLPFRLEYRYDVDLPSGCVSVEFALPKAQWFPAERMGDGGLEDCRALQGTFVALYGLRLSALLAACAFGSSVAITRCVVSAFDSSLGGEAVMGCDFDRLGFSRTGIEALEDDASRPVSDPAALARNLGAKAAMELSDGTLRPVEPLRVPGLGRNRGDLWRDRRPLSEPLSSLVMAETGADLDVYHDDFPAELEEVRSICSEEAETPVMAIMRLEELCDRILGALEDRGGLEGRSPLWSNSSPVRMLMAHAPAGGTRQTGAEGARDPLGITGDHDPQPGRPSRFYQLPDAFFEAKDAISRRYSDLGDFAQAMAVADQCVALAPTSVPPRVRRAVLLGDHGDFAQAEAELKVLLTMLVDTDDTGFCLYRLAFAYWQQGKPALAAAAYVLAARSPRFADQARLELADLLREESVEEPSVKQAAAALDADGAELPLDGTLLDTLGEAGGRLVDEGFPIAAWRPLKLLADRDNNDDLHSIAHSLRDGTPSAYL